MALCPLGHDKAVVGTYRGRCRECQRNRWRDPNPTHRRTAKRRLIERRSKRKARNDADLKRLEELCRKGR